MNIHINKYMTERKEFEENKVYLWGFKQASKALLDEYDKGNKNPFSLRKKKEPEPKPKTKEEKKPVKREFSMDEDYGINDLEFLEKEADRIDELLDNGDLKGDEEDDAMNKQEKLYDLIEGLKAMKRVSGGKIEQSKKARAVKGSEEAKAIGQRLAEARRAKSALRKIENAEEIKKKEDEKKKKLEDKIGKRKPWFYIGDIPKGYREANEDEAIEAKKVSEYGKYKCDRRKFDVYDRFGILLSPNLTQGYFNIYISIAKKRALKALREIKVLKTRIDAEKYAKDKETNKNKLTEAKADYKLLNAVYNALLKFVLERDGKPFTKVKLSLEPEPVIKYSKSEDKPIEKPKRPIDPRTGKEAEEYKYTDEKIKNKYHFFKGDDELILNDSHFDKNKLLKSKVALKLFNQKIILPSEYYGPDDYEKYFYIARKQPRGTGILDKLKEYGFYKEYRTPLENIYKPLTTPLLDLEYEQQGFTRKAKEILKYCGDSPISTINIRRTIVGEAIKGMINIISGGEFRKRLDESPYDDLYHLSLIISTKDNKVFSIEKNDVVNLDLPPVKVDKPTIREVHNIPDGITVNIMINNYINKKGKESFFVYNGVNNNCQNFVLMMLKMSGLGTQEDYEFIKQKTDAIFDDLEGTRNTMKTITDFSSRVRGLFGGEIKSDKHKNILNDISMLKRGGKITKLDLDDSSSDSDSSSSSSSEDEKPSKKKLIQILKKLKKKTKGRNIRLLHNVGSEEPIHKGSGASDYLNPIKNAFKTSWDKKIETPEERAVTKFVSKTMFPTLSKATEFVAPPVSKIAGKTGEFLSKKYGVGFKPKETLHIDINSHNNSDGEYKMGDGLKKKKRRGRPRKTTKVEVIHKLPYERFSHPYNASLHQLLESRNIMDNMNLSKNIGDMAKYIKDDMDNVRNEVRNLKNERDFYREAGGPLFGGSVKKKRFVKGSQEAKDHMAKIRAMKKK